MQDPFVVQALFGSTDLPRWRYDVQLRKMGRRHRAGDTQQFQVCCYP